MTDTRTSPVRAHTLARPLPEGAVILGATVEALTAARSEADGTRWIELAYAVSMTSSDVTLSREDFERCVTNFQKYPCVPVVIEHADTDWFGDREQSEPHGYVEELRVGEREVTEMDGATRTASTLEGRVSFDAATAPLVGPGKKWRFGSITILKGTVDEATGAGVGALLWSWSLTAHPRLTGLLPIAASLRLHTLDAAQLADARAALDAAQLTQARTALDPHTRNANAQETATMLKYLELAVRFGLAATSEDDARDKVLALASLGADTLKALSLSPSSSAQELASRLSSVTVSAAKVPALEQELTALRTDKAARDKTELDQYFAELFAVCPELHAAESALRFQAEHDPERFRQEHPRPSPAEIIQAAQHPERLTTIVPPSVNGNATAAGDAAQPSLVLSVVRTHMAIARSQGRELSFGAALQELGG